MPLYLFPVLKQFCILAHLKKKRQNFCLKCKKQSVMSSFNAESFRQQFPFFRHQPDWVYLDNAATTHKPYAVLDAVNDFYQQQNSNVHRGTHQLSEQATTTFEQARYDISRFINAASVQEIIFTSGTTAALNQLAFGLMHTVLQAGDRILLTTLEHHANIVPWQLHCQKYGVIVDVVPLDQDLQLDIQAWHQLLEKKPKVVSICHVSNVLGHIQPLATLLTQAKAVGAITIVDGAQGIVHCPVDMQQLDADFYVFSGHKFYAPTGTGVLYGKIAELEKLAPLQGGGEMISEVSFERTTLNSLPFRLEAGTPNIAGAIGLAAAINWIQQYDRQLLISHEQTLLKHLYTGLEQISKVSLLSRVDKNAGIVAFNITGEHSSDVAALLNQQKIAVRAGQHCAMPLFNAISSTGAVRCSLAPYNTLHDVEKSLLAIEQCVEILTA